VKIKAFTLGVLVLFTISCAKKKKVSLPKVEAPIDLFELEDEDLDDLPEEEDTGYVYEAPTGGWNGEQG
tara:strand:- start:132 stop:338 length:207 start_codon:yes stop_codon:yes gene_type:complete